MLLDCGIGRTPVIKAGPQNTEVMIKEQPSAQIQTSHIPQVYTLPLKSELSYKTMFEKNPKTTMI